MHHALRGGFTALLLTLAGQSLAAEGPLPPSPWGPDDTLGALNRLSPEKVLEAAKLITTGKTYALGGVTGRSTPAYAPRSFDITILQPGNGTGTTMGANKATGNDDLLRTWMGIGSQIDGLGHMGSEHVYFNNTHAEDFVTPKGLTKFGTHALPPMVTRGVLLDMTTHFKQDPIAPGTAFNRQEIDAVAKAQGLTLREGDVVLFHTGWAAMATEDPDAFMSGEPGLGLEGARYLAEIGVIAVGSDSWAVEALPFEDPSLVFPVHVELLAKNGIYILESMVTEALARDRAHEFLFVLGQPRFEGAVQAIINPIGLR